MILKRAIRFSFSGLIVTGVHFCIAYILIRYMLLFPPLANGVAFILATVVSYYINTLWSFSRGINGCTLFRFLVVSGFGFSLAIFVSWGVAVIGGGFLVGIIAVAGTVPIATFLMHNFWTYR